MFLFLQVKRSIQILILTLVWLFISTNAEEQIESDVQDQFDYQNLAAISVKESLIPIRQGIPEEIPFWNQYSKRFINAPAFHFDSVKGAVNYKFIATVSDDKEYSFVTVKPWDNLSPIWLELPVGYVELEVVGLNERGEELEQAGSRKFYKASSFKGPYNKKIMDYGKSAELALEYIFNQTHIQNWKTSGTPDTIAYKLYCYPAKIIGAVIESMVMYSRLSEENRFEALAIAQKAADYLIDISEPEGTPLEYFPPTYLGNAITAKEYQGQFMLIYPAEVAINYLNLFDSTNEEKYFDAAIRIAKTYKNLQLPSGTWNLKLWQNSERVKDNLCIPISIIELLDRLSDQYGVIDYCEMHERAYNWVMENPVKTFDWSGQFEDINPTEKYKNLTKHDACSFAIYLFEHSHKDSTKICLAEELLRYSEDQFLVWENPMPHIYPREQKWILPCGLEQYDYYVPIDASASKFMDTFLSAYKITGKQIYLAKAIEFANTMTVAQLSDTGRYPTYWELNDRRLVNEGWINCAVYDAKIMLKINNFLSDNKKHQ